ncbi:MAG: serine protein kinase PrkA [Desulfobacterales bacterium]|nr:serine protein kinase PrkA [Desulfobacterales bacterium]
MVDIKKAVQHLNLTMNEQGKQIPIPFSEFIKILAVKPHIVIRNIFQLFYDMLKTYMGEGIDEYPDDPESVHFVSYDCSKLFVEGVDHPFFADRLFANRLVNLVEALKLGAQQNKIYIFEGPHGCGKSTFLNNLLLKFEEYANSQDGLRYETVWRLNHEKLVNIRQYPTDPFYEEISKFLEKSDHAWYEPSNKYEDFYLTDDTIEIPCPSHDNPILMIPKAYRRSFFEELYSDVEFGSELFNEKEYEWVFRDNPCTVCSSLYHALVGRLGNPLKVFEMLYARPYYFSRRLGEGISVFNPGDKRLKETVLRNEMLQERINDFLKDSNLVRYIFSRYAKTNNGVYALMDIKACNTERLIELHNIISEGVHKVEHIEENVNSLFLALMNPEDKKNIKDYQSFLDRIEYISMSYIMDMNTEVEIYRNVFGKNIEAGFLPRVLHNFARVIISTRLKSKSEALEEWIKDPEKYRLYCDENLLLLKMEIYSGYIPVWLSEEDRKRLTAKRRQKIIAESEIEGKQGFSERDSIKIFNEFYSAYAKKDKLINMSMLCNFFTKSRRELNAMIPKGFLESLLRMYDYSILQTVKESLYYYNEEQIARDVQNYIFAVNFEIGASEFCKFTGEKIEIKEDFFNLIENRLLGAKIEKNQRMSYRKDCQKVYTTQTLPQEILLEGKPLKQTELYRLMYGQYVHNLKENVLDPFIGNENFRRAIKDFGEDGFNTYEKRIREDVRFLINNLCNKYRYTKQGAKEVCIYVIDNDLADKYANS